MCLPGKGKNGSMSRASRAAVFIAVLTAVSRSAAAGGAEEPVLRAGTARVDVTPALYQGIIGPAHRPGGQSA